MCSSFLLRDLEANDNYCFKTIKQNVKNSDIGQKV